MSDVYDLSRFGKDSAKCHVAKQFQHGPKCNGKSLKRHPEHEGNPCGAEPGCNPRRSQVARYSAPGWAAALEKARGATLASISGPHREERAKQGPQNDVALSQPAHRDLAQNGQDLLQGT